MSAYMYVLMYAYMYVLMSAYMYVSMCALHICINVYTSMY